MGAFARIMAGLASEGMAMREALLAHHPDIFARMKRKE